MSYDLRIGVKVQDTDIIAVIAEPERSSPTYNLGTMFRACTGWNYVQSEWYRVEEVLPLIEHGIHELKFNRKAYEKYIPENGYGSIDGALEALESLETCIQDQINGNAWQAVPIEHLWVAW
jgi:hypothetical protein